jgi:hypothetical protein
MSSVAFRAREYRRRRALGRIVVELESDEARASRALIDAGLLSPLVADDRESIEDALQRLITGFCEDKTP